MSSDPSGIDCGLDRTETLDYCTIVTLTASADFSSTFTSWGGTCISPVGICVFTLTESPSVMAGLTLEKIESKIYLPIIRRLLISAFTRTPLL